MFLGSFRSYRGVSRLWDVGFVFVFIYSDVLSIQNRNFKKIIKKWEILV